jgi:hypothetical protein
LKEGQFHKTGNIYLTEMHQYVADGTLGVKMHIIDFFSDSVIELMTSDMEQLQLIIIQIHIQL